VSPLRFGGRTHSLAGEGVGGPQFGREDRHSGAHMYFVLMTLSLKVCLQIAKTESIKNVYTFQLDISIQRLPSLAEELDVKKFATFCQYCII
jgi:hypothetical protein